MDAIEAKFARLGTTDAPGQEHRQAPTNLAGVMLGDKLTGDPVDFSHGDVDAFEPPPGAFDGFVAGVAQGGSQAYTEYLGRGDIRSELAEKLARFTGTQIDGADGLIITPGSQGALFLALSASVAPGDRVSVVQPDYFANGKIVHFLGGEVAPVRLDYLRGRDGAGLDLSGLEESFASGSRVFVFSNPNNPTGVVYSEAEVRRIIELASRYGATVIVDQLYSRLCYAGTTYTHLCKLGGDLRNLVTIMGPSKTESLSGYRLGIAFGSPRLIGRMEKLQAIVSLRAAGYNQSVLRSWFAEPPGWMDERIERHQAIRDHLHRVLSAVDGIRVRVSQAGSYLFPQLPPLKVLPIDFVRLLRDQANVIVTPGSEFGPYSADSIRLNFSQDHDKTVDAAERIVKLVKRYRR
ncbi:pyridoxal phosphate-dependent aminotransferase [Methylobacterium sp. J-030]|uniref:pyridoxal phosphate-dependent aminotransferase n=1 Tax=Methylobacterium sp. J-030 TaxID=2836627 RepID=UPI001FBC0E20|nr:pyridoxal phosphate-dependent aminotransferase [Methylobacterium sp. J-030]MCJ2067631.1 pyridoxal phosphate-dependent aminotransferase [Methylobacterium sp. J-030]